jgi:RimJ/RimL family protein N-acetyltransferase
MNLQPDNLSDDLVKLKPLSQTDFEALYRVASDPLIWEQHPNPNRYKREVFEVYFKGAIESSGAFLILDAKENSIIGCTRFYEHDAKSKTVLIGYTFFARANWGGTFNKEVKCLMINYAFQFVDAVIFHIGSKNIRSQKAIERLGAKKMDELQVSYYGENDNLNFVYQIKKSNF